MIKVDRTTRRFGAILADHNALQAEPLREQPDLPKHPLFFRGLLLGTALAIPLWAALLFAAWYVL